MGGPLHMGSAFGLGQFTTDHGEAVVPARVEVGVLVHPVHDVDELAQEQAGSDAHFAAQFPCHGIGETEQVTVIHSAPYALWVVGPVGVQLPYCQAQFVQCVQVEAGKADLGGVQVVVGGVGQEVGVQTLGQRCQALDPLRPVVERRGSCDDQVEPGELSVGDLVQQLPKRVEALFPGVGAGTLEGLQLIQDHDQPGATTVAQQNEPPPECGQGTEVVEVPLDPGVAFGRGCDVGLSAQPGDECLGDGGFVLGLGPVVAAQGCGEPGVGGGDLAQAALHQGGDGGVERFLVRFVHLPGGQDVLLQGVEPVVDDLP